MDSTKHNNFTSAGLLVLAARSGWRDRCQPLWQLEPVVHSKHTFSAIGGLSALHSHPRGVTSFLWHLLLWSPVRINLSLPNSSVLIQFTLNANKPMRRACSLSVCLHHSLVDCSANEICSRSNDPMIRKQDSLQGSCWKYKDNISYIFILRSQ